MEGNTDLCGILIFIVTFGIRNGAMATCAPPHEDFVAFNGRWYIQPSASKSSFSSVSCPSGSRMATAQNEDDYKAILHFYQRNGAKMWVGFKNPSGSNTCTNEGCNNLIEWVDGTKFTYQSFMTQGIRMKGGADCFALFDSGEIVGETGCDSRAYSYLCQSTCQGAYTPCFEPPPPVGGITKRTSNWDQTTKDFNIVITIKCFSEVNWGKDDITIPESINAQSDRANNWSMDYQEDFLFYLNPNFSESIDFTFFLIPLKFGFLLA